jgi:hypothetical protein
LQVGDPENQRIVQKDHVGQKEFGGPAQTRRRGKEFENGTVDRIKIEGKRRNHDDDFNADQKVGDGCPDDQQSLLFIFNHLMPVSRCSL